jgi:heme/copper-type cytochrome/quinol oxidase subunit 4
MRVSEVKSSMVGLASAIVASLCCILPLAVVLLGIGSGAFMMTTMKYSYIFIPLGIMGLGLGYFLYFREKKKCDAKACKMAGGRLNLIILIGATIVVMTAIAFDLFPEIIAPILGGAS